MDGQMLPTLASLGMLTVSKSGDMVMIMAPAMGTNATVINADNDASSSYVHVIDAVLAPGNVTLPGTGGAMAGSPSAAPMPAMAPGGSPAGASSQTGSDAPAGAAEAAGGAAGLSVGAVGVAAVALIAVLA